MRDVDTSSGRTYSKLPDGAAPDARKQRLMMPGKPTITDLPELMAALPLEEDGIAGRLLEVTATTGRLVEPEGMRHWIERTFGSVDQVREQRIVRVTNRVTLEGTLFNDLRASRPLDTGAQAGDTSLEAEISATEGDPFCSPESGTPADVFGRVRGEHATTASNVAKYDGFHGIIVFDDHDPLDLTLEKVSDYISTGLEWLRRARRIDPESRYPFLMWNCLWRAGGSIIHGHAQVTATRGSHYPKVERLRRDAASYAAEYGRGYFDDLFRLHDALGLSIPSPDGTRAYASLTPVKEKEVVISGNSPDDPALHRAVGGLLESYVRGLGVRSFNLAFYMPPAEPGGEWRDFPTLVYLVDREDPASRTSDMGAMELYAASVVASDPFGVARALSG